MPIFTADELQRFATSVFQSAGVPVGIARRVGESLVESNLQGHDSHGVIRIVQYLRDLRQGVINPQAEIETLRDAPAMAFLDAHWQFGQVAAAQGMRLAIEKARQSHVATVAVVHCYHVGRLGEYAEMAAEQGFIGLVVCNSGRPAVAPHGGMARILGTNPIACAVPAGRYPPFIMDMATSTVAEGKLRVARSKGEAIPEGWVLDREGNPTTDVADYYDGGTLLPLGGYKGYALSLLVDLIGGVLVGQGCASLSREYNPGNGVLILALDVEAFRPLAELGEGADRLFDQVKACPRAPGFDEILIAGEPERRMKARRLREGIPIAENTWQEILRAAARTGFDTEPWLNKRRQS